MNQKTLKLTTGAMCTAIFGLLLLLNRQTGQLLEEMFLFLFPIPMVAFSALYGLKSSLPVLAAMSLFTVFFGTFTTIFYALTQAVIGLIFGECLHRKLDMTKTLFAVMALSAVSCLLNSVVLAGLFGADLSTQIAELQTVMNESIERAMALFPEGSLNTESIEQMRNLMSTDYLRRIFIVSMAFSGLVQGFLVYEISLLVLKRLRFPVSRPRSVFLYDPPKWSGFAALILFYLYQLVTIRPMENELFQSLVQTAGLCGYLYLLCFGWIGLLLFLKVRLPGVAGGLRVLIVLLLMFLMPLLVLLMGALYLVTSLHQRLADELFSRQARP